MALSKVTAAIESLTKEVALSTVDKLVAFLDEKIEMTEDLKEIFSEFKEKLSADLKTEAKAAKPKVTKKAAKAESSSSSDGEKKEKKKRAPSAYNLFIKEKMAEVKAANPGMKAKDLMKSAIEMWNAEKAAKAEKTEKTEETEETATSDE